MNRRLASLSLAAGLMAAGLILAAGAAPAQTTPSASSGLSPGAGIATGNVPQAAGGIPPAAGGAGDRSGSVTATGQTKPPGAALGGREGTSTDLETKSRQMDEKIDRGICRGC